MAQVEKPAGSGGVYVYTLTQAPAAAPTRTIFSDPARTTVVAAAETMAATSNPAAFTGTYPLTLPAGRFYLRHVFTTIGGATVTDDDDELLLVQASGTVAATAVPLGLVKKRLNKQATVDDAELLDMLQAAEAEYVEHVGPLLTTTMPAEEHTGKVLRLRHTPVVAVLSVTQNGLAVTGWTLNADAGLLTTPYAGTFTVIYTAGYDVLPANIRELIAADVAGYFAATQRGGGAVRPGFPGEGYTDAYDAPGMPLTLFPRIQALARSQAVVA